jgi:uncharacterized repeat protein (TIGR02543 family)
VLNVYYKRVVYTFFFTPYYSAYSDTANATMTIGSSTYTNSNRYNFTAKYEGDVSAVWPVRPLAQLKTASSNINFQGWTTPAGTPVFVSKVVSISIDLLPSSGTSQTMTARWITTGMNVNLHYMFESVDGNIPGAVYYNGKYYVQDETYSQSAFSPGSAFNLKEIEGMRALTANALRKTASGSFEAVSSGTFVDQYLFYDRIRYSISFNSQGGNSVDEISGILPKTSLASRRPTDPTLTGSVFDGWYTSSDYTVLFDFSSETMPDTNLILYAKWTQNPYTVSVYDGLANSTLLGAYQRAQGEYVGDPVAALSAGGIDVQYTVGSIYPGKGEFLGWVIPIGPGETTTLSPELPVTGDMSVYADWRPQTFTVTYKAGIATGVPPTDDNDYQRGVSARVLEPTGSAIGGGSLVAPDDKAFIGWIDDDGRIHYPGEMMVVSKDIVLTASYETVDKVVIYVYHINYPSDAEDADGNPITDPGNLKQYVEPEANFTAIAYGVYSTPVPEGYSFEGWATSSAMAAAGNVAYTEGGVYRAAAASSQNDEHDMYGVWAKKTKYFPVTFDADAGGTMDSGKTQVTYQIPEGSSLGALGISVPGIQPRETDYEFTGWAPSDDLPNIISNSAIYARTVTAPTTYMAIYAKEAPPLTGYYYSVTFDAGGEYGDIAKDGGDSGETVAVYQVPIGSSLGAENIPIPQVKLKNSDATFIGWALSDGDGSPMGNAQISGAPVNAPVTYVATYSITPPPLIERYLSVIFDAGGVYGNLSDGTSSTAIAVKKGTALGDVYGFITPTVATVDSDFSFIGWSPTVDLTSPVNDVITYRAQYAYTPGGRSTTDIYHTVSFELGTEGNYKYPPITSYSVLDGTSLGALTTTSGSAVFYGPYFDASNIQTIDGFVFTGWMPTLDTDAPVYADIVYYANYDYNPGYTPLHVDDDDNSPDESVIHAHGYERYYDGNPHYITYGAVGLTGVLSFWYDPSGKGLPLSESINQSSVTTGGAWMEGIPPGEVNVTNEVVDLIFTAQGKEPREVTRSAIIKPRPLVPAATHVDIKVGDYIPLRATYGLTIGYDGKKQNGDPIGDNFDFAAHEGEFDNDGLQITTTYMQGDPAGDYPIYVKAGIYGNYEIYEGTEGNWEFFPGWRIAGVLHVNAASDTPVPTPSGGGIDNNPPVDDNTNTNDGGDGDDGDNDSDDDSDDDGSNDDDTSGAPGSRSGVADTGDAANPALWTTLLIVSLANLLALFITYRRRKKAMTE